MSKTVLVVDDAAFMRMMIRDILTGEGYVVREAVNGLDAVKKYTEQRPDLVTLDITMPEMNGLDALRAIREADPHARVLMVSSMGQQQMILEALESGAMDFVIKPFQPTKVLETVKKCLQSRQR